MHKKENLAKKMAREQSKTGWLPTLRERKMYTLGESNQLHMSLGRGHHLARSLKGHDRQWNKS